MGVYVKGMEMPTKGYRLIVVDADGTAQTTNGEKTTVSVPEPHGRLIDADKMRESIRKQTAFLRLIGGEFAEIAETLEKGFLQEIDNAPTIIPAEPAREENN